MRTAGSTARSKRKRAGDPYRPPAKSASMSEGSRLPGSEAVADLVCPEALEPAQGHIHALEFVGRDTADLLDG